MVKCSGHDDCLYGQLYKQRKAYEQSRNEQGLYAEQAARMLVDKRIGEDTEAYKHYVQGRLPPGHIHARSKRWAAKLFLSHWHEAATVARYGRLPVKPFAIERLGHHTWYRPMHMELIPGWAELRRAAMTEPVQRRGPRRRREPEGVRGPWTQREPRLACGPCAGCAPGYLRGPNAGCAHATGATDDPAKPRQSCRYVFGLISRPYWIIVTL
jgi:hypothetical protein